MKKYTPTICGMVAGLLFGAIRSSVMFIVIPLFWMVCYVVVGALIGFGVGAFWPAIARRTKITSPIKWFIGCTMLVLLAFLGGSLNMPNYYLLLPVGLLGMVLSLILSFIPRVSAAGPGVSPESASVQERNPRLLAFLCIAHAALLTGAVFGSTKYSNLLSSFADSTSHILGIIWLVLLGVWPLWIIAFLWSGWKFQRIMVTALVGLTILSPLFFWFLVIWALGHGGSLG